MGNHSDAEITEIVVVLATHYGNRMAEAVEKLKAAEMEIDRADDDNDIVEGTIESDKLDGLRKLDCVNYIRTVMTYIADYPPGDPRNKDGPEDDDD
jgi:ABC-type phosphonate transport system ATPase subunit